MVAKADRIESLRELVQRNGVDLESVDDDIERLEEWLRREIVGDVAVPGNLQPIWYSVINDVALFLGEWIIERVPNIHWAFFDRGKRDASFQRPVLMGFSKVSNPAYNVDLDWLVGTFANRLAAGLDEPGGAFRSWIEAAKAQA